MVRKQRYCADSLMQIHSGMDAILSVEGNILCKHLRNCVISVFKDKRESEKDRKIVEVVTLLRRFLRS